MGFIKKDGAGIFVCMLIAVPSWFLGKQFPVIGGAVIAILSGMVLALCLGDRTKIESGIKFTSKKILQWAVVLLGFGMDLNVILKTGRQSLPIIICTIAAALAIAYVLHRVMHIPAKIATLVGVGSSICGGSAIAATAPVIEADDDDVAQAISVIFFFNVLAAVLFPVLGRAIGFDTTSGQAFGVFVGTAVNDTSSVTAAASTWDSMWNLGSATLDTAVMVKLTRTLAIIPITLILALVRTRAAKDVSGGRVCFRQIFPFFILYFIAASAITTVAVNFHVPLYCFYPMKEFSKFLIVLAMAAIGLNTNIVKLIKTGGKPIIMGGCCWVGITIVSLFVQCLTGIW